MNATPTPADRTAATRRPSYRPFAVEVRDIEDLSPTFRRLTLTGPDLHECGNTLLDQRIKMVLADPNPDLLRHDWYTTWRALPDAQRPAMRTYTLAAVDHATGTVALDIACRPAHGPASRFAHQATPGTQFVIIAPDALSPDATTDGIAWRPGTATDIHLVGDETALPAIRNILRTLPPGVTGRVVLDLPHVADAVDLPRPPGVSIDILTRDPRGVGVAAAALLRTPIPAPPRRPLTKRPDDLPWEEADTPDPTTTYAWHAGEATWIAALRRAHRDRGQPPPASSFMGYWRHGQASPG